MEKTRYPHLTLSKKALTIEVSVSEDAIPEVAAPEVESSDSKIDRALEKFESLIKDLGYIDYTFEFVETPFTTNRGILHAKGGFVGPSPFGKSSRAPEDESNYSFIVVEDEDIGDYFIEAKHKSALIASYKLTSEGLESVDGELPHA